MDDLISKKTLLEAYDNAHKGPPGGARKLIEEAPEAIVRCKDCKYLIDHYGFMDDGYCKNMRETYYLKFKPEDVWFCADGERK